MEQNLKILGFRLASVCRFCMNQEESWDHLYCNCVSLRKAWAWLYELFHITFQDTNAFLKFKHATNLSAAVRQLWVIAVVALIVAIWKCRNRVIIDNASASIEAIIAMVRSDIKLYEPLVTSRMNNTVKELLILKNMGISCKAPKGKACAFAIWLPPCKNFIKLNTDGAARGNPGPAGVGVLACNSEGEVLASLWKNIGVKTNFYAEFEAVLSAMEIATSISGLTFGWNVIMRLLFRHPNK